MVQGRNLILALNNTAIAAAKSCSLKVQQNFIEACSPTSGRTKKKIPTDYLWDLSCDCLMAKGCWEAYSSATGLIRMTKEKLMETKDTIMWDMVEGDIEKTSGRTAFNAAKQGDKAGKEVVDMYINYLAYGMVNIVNIFQPQVFAIGGGVCGEGDYLLNPVKEIVDRDQYGTNSHDDKTVIKIAELGNDAGIIGAASLGL